MRRSGYHQRPHRRRKPKGSGTYRAGLGRAMTSTDKSPAFKLGGYNSAYGYGGPYNQYKTGISKKIGKKDYAFRRWLIKEKNIEPAYLFAFGTPSLVGRYRREYNEGRRIKKVGVVGENKWYILYPKSSGGKAKLRIGKPTLRDKERYGFSEGPFHDSAGAFYRMKQMGF